MTSIICLCELVPLNGLLFDDWVNNVVKELNVEEALKSSIFVIQKAAALKNGQGSNGTSRSSLATSHDVSGHRAVALTFDQSEAEKLSQTHRYIHGESTYCQALLYEQRLQKIFFGW